MELPAKEAEIVVCPAARIVRLSPSNVATVVFEDAQVIGDKEFGFVNVGGV